VARKKKLKAEFLGAGKEAIVAAKKSGRAVSDVIEVRTIRSNGQLHLLVLHCGHVGTQPTIFKCNKTREQ
jgi:hypothetical protein